MQLVEKFLLADFHFQTTAIFQQDFLPTYKEGNKEKSIALHFWRCFSSLWLEK